MRMTKKRVSGLLTKHSGNGGSAPMVGDLMTIGFEASRHLEQHQIDAAYANAYRWGWIDIYGRLTRIGWRAI